MWRGVILWLGVLLPFAALAAAEGDLTAAALGALSYRGVLDQPVQLEDGRWAGAPYVPGAASRPAVELARNGIVRGDLDGDGRDEAAVLLLESSGGTGLQHHVAVAAVRDGALRNVASAHVGDRIQVMRFAIDDGRVVLDAVVAGPDDPMCCPTLKLRRRLALEGDELAVEEEALGAVGLADLGGTAWRLTRLDVTESQGSDAVITLSLDGGSLAGAAGCNRYTSDVTSKGGQQVTLGPIAATRKSCPAEVMADEQAFLERLERVERFTFVLGELALTYRNDGHSGTLFFERSEAKK